MLQKILFLFIVFVIFLSGYFYFFRDAGVEVQEDPLPQNPSKYIWNEYGENINLLQFDSNYTKGQRAIIKTNFGNIKIMLYPEEAPKACENFVGLSKEGFYTGLEFTQTSDNYFVKSGDPQDGTGGRSIWDKPFPNEYSPDLWNFRGAVGMASTEKNQNESQFYIVSNRTIDEKTILNMEKNEFPEKVMERYKSVGGAPWLDGKHTVFGHVITGMDVVEKIQNNTTDEPAVIEEIIIE